MSKLRKITKISFFALLTSILAGSTALNTYAANLYTNWGEPYVVCSDIPSDQGQIPERQMMTIFGGLMLTEIHPATEAGDWNDGWVEVFNNHNCVYDMQKLRLIANDPQNYSGFHEPRDTWPDTYISDLDDTLNHYPSQQRFLFPMQYHVFHIQTTPEYRFTPSEHRLITLESLRNGAMRGTEFGGANTEWCSDNNGVIPAGYSCVLPTVDYDYFDTFLDDTPTPGTGPEIFIPDQYSFGEPYRTIFELEDYIDELITIEWPGVQDIIDNYLANEVAQNPGGQTQNTVGSAYGPSTSSRESSYGRGSGNTNSQNSSNELASNTNDAKHGSITSTLNGANSNSIVRASSSSNQTSTSTSTTATSAVVNPASTRFPGLDDSGAPEVGNEPDGSVQTNSQTSSQGGDSASASDGALDGATAVASLAGMPPEFIAIFIAMLALVGSAILVFILAKRRKESRR